MTVAVLQFSLCSYLVTYAEASLPSISSKEPRLLLFSVPSIAVVVLHGVETLNPNVVCTWLHDCRLSAETLEQTLASSGISPSITSGTLRTLARTFQREKKWWSRWHVY